jgi:thioredoxin reductase (NADPH)
VEIREKGSGIKNVVQRIGGMMENVLILGTGCAGLTAAIYVARANLNPVVITGYEPGGQLTLTTVVENFPGFPEGIYGSELTENMRKQAEKFGARVIMDSAKRFDVREDGTFEIETSKETFLAKTIIVSTGASARWLDIPSEAPYKGRGVHTCATCDGAFYKDKEVIIVGGGDSASEEGSFLTKFAKKVTIVHRKDHMRASKIMQDRVFKNPRIEIIWDTAIDEFKGDGKSVQSVVLRNLKTNETTDFPVDGVFLAIGHIPNTDIFKGKLDLDEQGFLVADRNMHTNIPGVFAAGDVQDKRYKQAITAAGSGCQAAIEAERYIAEHEK